MLVGSMVVAIGGIGLIVFIVISLIVVLVKFIFLGNSKYKNVDFDSMTGYEFEDFCVEVKSYGLYEDLYRCTLYGVEEVYEDYWKEKNGEM